MSSQAADGPIPLISQLSPLTVAPGANGATLIVNGAGFLTGATVYWNGGSMATQYISESQLSVSVPFSDLALPSTAAITVQNPGAQPSNVAYLQISSPELTLGFSGPQLSTNGPAYSVAAGDFTGSGKLDLVSGSTETSSVSVAMGNGDGTFGSPQSYAVGAVATFCIVAADFNGDGKLDIAAAAVGATSVVSVLLGNGDGTFQAHRDLVVTSGEILTDLAVADFNGDGKLDLAIMGESNTVLVALGNGDGTFQAPNSFNVGNDAEWGTVGDFNRDGKLDLAVTNYVDSTVSILLGNGDGTFQPQMVYSAATNPGSIVTGDFLGNGKLDLATTARTSNTSVFAVSVLLGNGDGTFQPQTEYTVGADPDQLVTGDFNGDGKLDLATVNACGDDPNCGSTSSATVSILTGNGDGTFQGHVDFPAGFEASQVTSGDFNDDGKDDLVSAAGSLFVLLQTTATLSSGALSFGGQSVGTASAPQLVTLTNTSALPLTISNIGLTGSNPGDYSFTTGCGSVLGAGASCTISVTFTPAAAGTRTAFVSITDSALGSPQNIALTGTGVVPSVLITPTSLKFPTTLVGRTGAAMIVTVDNVGNASLTLSNITVSGAFTDVSACPGSLAAGEGCTIAVYFRPAKGGASSGVMSLYDNAPNSPQTVALSGTGTYFKLSATVVNFGKVPLGKSSQKTVTVTNTAKIAEAVNGISIGGANANEFSQTNTCGSSLGPGAACQITLTFQPNKSGSAGATLQVNGGGGIETATLVATGTQ
jgi:FG-GAP-like repeat/Abnormal spindle-like microcephaly-assoc'd, ASPM-SPD-2-Hydin